ncbi:MAG: tetratricopeptide repeat protein [Acidobacteriota bacterium]
MAEKRLVLLKKANKYFRQQKNDAAIKEFKKVLNIKPDDLEVRRIIGDIELKNKNLKSAIEQFEWMADYYLKEGFFTKAIAMYKRITRIDPKYDQASFRLAELYARQGLIIEAKQIYLEMAEEYKRNNNQIKSLEMYKKILEFDRNNIKMRLILAENYMREKLMDMAVGEYLIASDILLNKKDYAKIEEILSGVIKKVKDLKLIEKLVYSYKVQQKDDKAIKMLKGLGSELFKNVNLLKILGELYFKKNQVDDAEMIFKKITDIDPNETEVLLKLGKVYLQREEYEKTFNLFIPIIDRYMGEGKIEDATALLRLIIASNNSYIPALHKLASIFRENDKKTNLIALNESLVPLYENKGMKDELRAVLEELIKLSDSPFNYEEKLAALTGEKLSKEEVEIQEKSDEEERENEIVSHQLRVVEEKLKISEIDIAVETLKKIKKEFPSNCKIREKLFDIYTRRKEMKPALDEGKELLDLYKLQNNFEKYEVLLEELSKVSPEDEKLVELSGEERTNIDMNFDQSELEDQMDDIENSGMREIDLDINYPPDSPDVLVLSEDESIVEKEPEKIDIKKSESISGYISEIDFYINDGYFGDAEKLAEELLEKFPENKEILKRVEKLKKAKLDKIDDIARPEEEEKSELDVNEIVLGSGVENEFELELTDGKSDAPANKSDSSTFRENINYQDNIGDEISFGDIIPEENKADIELEKPIPLENELSDALDKNEDIFNIETSLSDESSGVQEMEDSKFDIDIDNIPLPEEKVPVKSEFSDISKMQYEIEMEEPEENSDVIIDKIDEEILVQSPAVEEKDTKESSGLSSSGVMLNLENAIEEESADEEESPFEDISHNDIMLENEEELLKEELSFADSGEFLEIEDGIPGELEALKHWMKELEKQRTSTVEKNMMEIFEEFKKGVDEKIGQEDFDTRYNLGIAYKEMGLIEEAIHEFLIASKHPKKFFDSAGLLGMCFRDKGMVDDSIAWFNKALQTPKRSNEEYMAVKYELVISYKMKEDYSSALQVVEELYKENKSFRDITELRESLKTKL